MSRFATNWSANDAKIEFCGRLCALLTPYLGQDQRTTDEDKMNVIGIIGSVTHNLGQEMSHSIFCDLSVTLGPNKSTAGIKSFAVRHSIVVLMLKLAGQTPRLKDITALLFAISKTDEKRVDELDFETVIPGLQRLSEGSEEGIWHSLCKEPESVPMDLTALLNTCFHYLYSEDGVVSRASFTALKTVVAAAGRSSGKGFNDAGDWEKLVESVVVPSSRSGLLSRDLQVRRYCILLVRDISRQFKDNSSPFLCGDLWKFCDDENPDLDFFFGVTHVQIHRRARAFQRLRQTVSTLLVNDSGVLGLSPQSLSNVLVPLALHPLYESKTNTEEGLALEAVATLGILSKMLSWSKYSNILWSLLSQLDRHPDQERYLIGGLCAVIDAFHFDLMAHEHAKDDCNAKSPVWRSVENRIVPKMEAILTKDITDRSGNRTKSLRPAIVLALTKLFQKFPNEFFETKLSGILTVICDVLRTRDSNSRDVARLTLAKIACSIDLRYLGDVIRELAVTLTEGFKLHVRAAAVHTILLELARVYEPPTKETADSSNSLHFDQCIPALMELIQDDLFGEANERRESEDNSVRYVKEAGGNKSIHSVELISRMLYFSPSDASNTSRQISAVHALVTPFLERLRVPGVETKTIQKIKEVLSRVVAGLSNNRSVTSEELLPFVYATIYPYIGEEALKSVQQDLSSSSNDDDDGSEADAIRVSGGKDRQSRKALVTNDRLAVVVDWRPSSLNSSSSAKTAMELKDDARRKLRKVQDGSDAPKLTGSSRHASIERFRGNDVNEPAAVGAVSFGLNLMSACLKKIDLDRVLPMMDPFVPLLTAFVCYSRNTEVALVALKCLHSFIRLNLPSISRCAKSLGSRTLSLLASSGSNSKQNHGMTQACFKTLAYLINNEKSQDCLTDDKKNGEDAEHVFMNSCAMPLSAEQLRVLCGLLQFSIAETDQYNPALNLIKALMSHRYMSPEFYDLMESMAKLVVRSSKPTLRQQCATLFSRFLLDYPMAEEKFEQLLEQVVANIRYEHQDGRMSGVTLLTLVIEKLPDELIEKHGHKMFLPLVMQLLNDESKDCRANVSQCMVALFNRSSKELQRTFHEYCRRWSKQSGSLRLASVQVFCLMVEARVDAIQVASVLESWIRSVEDNLEAREHVEWEVVYFSLMSIEKLLTTGFGQSCIEKPGLWLSITNCLVHSHVWIQKSSSRILKDLVSSKSAVTVLTHTKGMLFDIIRNLCNQLNAPEEEQHQELSDLSIKTLSVILPLISEHPQLCYKIEEQEPETRNVMDRRGRNPVFWLMRRLSQIAKQKGSTRRMTIYKCYAAFATNNFAIIVNHLDLMLDGLHRSITEGKNEVDNSAFAFFTKKDSRSGGQHEGIIEASSKSIQNDEYTMAQEILRLLEDSCSQPETFLTAYASVKRRARDKKEQRKSVEKSQAVLDPQAFAQHKIEKNAQKNEQRKRRTLQEQRQQRVGGVKKTRRSTT